jgi:GAF domain-containing protein
MIHDIGRLSVLAGIDLDNADLRQRLDAITERTAGRLGQPVCLVSMVLDSAQEFAGAHGLDGWLSDVGGTPVEWSFCSTVVETSEAYVVADAATDPDQSGNPLVGFDGVRSYAGAPVVVDGAVVGAHCVFGFEAHAFTDEDMAELEAAADEIATLLRAYPLPRPGTATPQPLR